MKITDRILNVDISFHSTFEIDKFHHMSWHRIWIGDCAVILYDDLERIVCVLFITLITYHLKISKCLPYIFINRIQEIIKSCTVVNSFDSISLKKNFVLSKTNINIVCKEKDNSQIFFHTFSSQRRRWRYLILEELVRTHLRRIKGRMKQQYERFRLRFIIKEKWPILWFWLTNFVKFEIRLANI